jgi:hypothetical protein
MRTAAQVRQLLNLIPLPAEGGYFAETYKSELLVPTGALPPSFERSRSLATAIFYLLTPDTFSALHRLRSDELYHFYLGDPVELVELHSDGAATRTILGQDLDAGMRLQHLVRAGTWQGSHLVAGGGWALLGTTMSPGFEFADFELGRRDLLLAQFSAATNDIERLTRI